jgi:flagellar basal-body rod protein FlgC
MYGSLDISTSGLIAQRTRLTAVAANIANKDAMFDAQGNFSPYREREAMFAVGNPGSPTREGQELGVHVAQISESQAEFPLKYDPGNPYAYKDGPKQGYVPTSNVDMFKQMVEQMDATRAYEANIAAAEATKLMTSAALRLLA